MMQIPRSISAEKAVIGIMIKREEPRIDLMEILNEQSFSTPANREIFKAVCELSMQSQAIDEITLCEYLKDRQRLDRAGGIDYVTRLPREVPYISNYMDYAGILKEKQKKRALTQAVEDITDMLKNSDEDVDKITAMAEKKIFDISQNQTKSDLTRLEDTWVKMYLELGMGSSKRGEITGLRTYFYDLDKITAGLQNSDLIVLAARPGVGKTSFAMNIALNAAENDNKKIAVFSLEMSKDQLVRRLASSYAKVDMGKLKTRDLNDTDFTKLAQAMSKKSIQHNIFIDDTAGITLPEIASKLRRQKHTEGCDLAIIDYLQLINPTGKSESRNLEIAKISRDIKILAKELDIPIILLSQLSRRAEGSSKELAPRPMLSHLRDSGSIEQDADIVLFLYKEQKQDQAPTVELIIEKHRNGATGSIELGWEGRCTKFFNLRR